MRLATVLIGLTFMGASSLLAQRFVPINPPSDRIEEGIRFDDLFQMVLPDGTVAEYSRCGTPSRLEAPEEFSLLLPESAADCGNSTNPDPAYNPGQAYLIDVWVHVLRNNAGTQGDIPVAELYEQIAVLNEDYRGIPGSLGDPGADTRFFFRLKGYDYWNNTSWFNDSGTYYTTIHSQPNAADYDPQFVMNIFTNQAGGNLGYVPFLPHQAPTQVGTPADRVVILHSAFGRNRGFAPYDKGRTTTHEVGHYLGLFHTFEAGCVNGVAPTCYSNGDRICDTPAEQSANLMCPRPLLGTAVRFSPATTRLKTTWTTPKTCAWTVLRRNRCVGCAAPFSTAGPRSEGRSFSTTTLKRETRTLGMQRASEKARTSVSSLRS
jgi:hypothetical protein